MDTSHTQRLIKKMLANRDLMPETREELEEHLEELEKGALHPDDARYIEGLAQRLGLAEGGAGPAGGAGDTEDDDSYFVGNERASDTATAVQSEMALRKVEQARELVARLRQPPTEGDTPEMAAAAQAATLQEIETALADAAEALQRNG